MGVQAFPKVFTETACQVVPSLKGSAGCGRVGSYSPKKLQEFVTFFKTRFQGILMFFQMFITSWNLHFQKHAILKGAHLGVSPATWLEDPLVAIRCDMKTGPEWPSFSSSAVQCKAGPAMGGDRWLESALGGGCQPIFF